MELPIRVKQLISEYSKPLTRPDWKKGSACNSAFKNDNVMIYLHNRTICLSLYKVYIKNINTDHIDFDYKELKKNKSFSEDIEQYGEMVFKLYSILFDDNPTYNNFYFFLKYDTIKKLRNTTTFKYTNILNEYNEVVDVKIEI
jgi:hypothetical protein